MRRAPDRPCPAPGKAPPAPRAARRRPRRRGSVRIPTRVAAIGAALPGLLVMACLAPWTEVTVSPAIRGRVTSGVRAEEPIRLRLVVRHRENPSVHHVQAIRLAPTAHFAFAPVVLPVAGREYSKVYRAFLHLDANDTSAPGDPERVIWRADFSRRRLAGPIELHCDLERPVALGQACRVLEATAQPWLVDQGRRDFGRLCATCHGEDATGGTGPGAAPDLTRLAARLEGRFAHDAIARWIEGRSAPDAHGVRTMPVWGERLSAEYARYAEGDELIGAKLDPILAYLESIQRDD